MRNHNIPPQEPSKEIIAKLKNFNVKYKTIASMYKSHNIPAGGSLIIDILNTKRIVTTKKDEKFSLKHSEKEILEWIASWENELDSCLKQTVNIENELSLDDREELNSAIKTINDRFKIKGVEKTLAISFDKTILISVYNGDNYLNPEIHNFNDFEAVMEFLNWLELFEDDFFSKEQWQVIKEKIQAINRLSADSDCIIPCISVDGIFVLDTMFNGHENEILCYDFEMTIKQLDCMLNQEERFLQSGYEIKEPIDDFDKKYKITIETIESLIKDLNAQNKQDDKYNYLFNNNGTGDEEITLIENDSKMTKFNNFKTFNEWVQAQLSKEPLTNEWKINSKINLAVNIFNIKNRNENIIMEVQINKDKSITVSLISSITKKLVTEDIKFKNPQKFIDWAEKQKLI